MKKPILCITGGHLTPALAVIEEIKEQHPDWTMFFIGRRNSFEGGGGPTQEERLVTSFGVPFYALTTGRGTGFFKVPIGFFQALYWFLTYRPTIVLSFGGYVALPVAIAAWTLGVPVVTHEQTEVLGLANKIIARFARCVILARESGVPIRRGLFHPPAHPSFSIDTSRPILYVTGGSTGARSLNALVFSIVSELTRAWTVIHQAGVEDMKNARPPTRQYVVAPYFDTQDVSWIYHHAALLIGRSGANTTAEVAAFGLPAIFIPLPWAAGGEQTKNAQKLAEKGAAIVVDQRALTSDKLLSSIKTVMESLTEYRKHSRLVVKTYPRDAAKNVVEKIETIIS